MLLYHIISNHQVPLHRTYADAAYAYTDAYTHTAYTDAYTDAYTVHRLYHIIS